MSTVTKRPYRIGCGAGFSADRLPPALDLIEYGELDALIVECVGERTLAFGHRDRMRDASKGYNVYLERRMRAMLPLCRRHDVKLITNMGVANPASAAIKTASIAKELGITGLKIAVLLGDDVTDRIKPETALWEGLSVSDVAHDIVGANVYLGAEQMLEAMDADVIITGRVADPSLTLAPLMHHFGWQPCDWHKLAAGTLAGHLIECGMQVTGGYFADPGRKHVPDLANCGYPIAQVDESGAIRISKLEHTGGLLNRATVKEQLLYEVHDPNAYVTPDVTASFQNVDIQQDNSSVLISGATGQERPADLKVTVGFDAGFLAEAGISYAGVGAIGRARLARSVLESRLDHLRADVRLDIIGVDSLHGGAQIDKVSESSNDVRLRLATRSSDPELLETVLWEAEALLCCGPAGGGGFRRSITPAIATYSSSMPRDAVHTVTEWINV